MAGRNLHIIRDESPSARNGPRFRIIVTGQRGAEMGFGEASPEFADADALSAALRDLSVSRQAIDRVFADAGVIELVLCPINNWTIGFTWYMRRKPRLLGAKNERDSRRVYGFYSPAISGTQH